MSERQIKEYYERIEKLLNGANKETYGFVPQEIKNILRSYEELQNQNQELKKQLEEYQEEVCILDMRTDENIKYKNQQKEFINYMMNTIENITHDETDDEEIKGYLIQRGNTFKEILSKYQEIIGENNER